MTSDSPAPSSPRPHKEDPSQAVAARGRSPLRFFLLVFALSIPFWALGAVTGIQLLPGLPVSSLGAFCPVIAASILVYLENGTPGVIELLKRSFDFQRINARVWYVPVVLLMPGATALTFAVMRWMGSPLPTPQFTFLAAIGLSAAFFLAALGEELGWSGYAIDPIQDRGTALEAGLLLGVVWAAWHIVPLLQAARALDWIAWWCLFTVALRVLIVWIYNNTGKSVFAATLTHALSNVSTILFASYFDPRITAPIVAFAATIVVVLWGPRTLSRYPHK